MNCPACKSIVLVMSERSGVEIDYCPQCRGVWLDRGELDKIIRQSEPAPTQPVMPASPPPPQMQYPQQTYRKRDDDSVDEYPQEYRGEYPKRKKSWLKEVFDF
jgi:uncharacterized protein